MKHPWIPFYWGDYLADTTHLTQGQHAAYLLLLGWYYSQGRPLPANEKQLLRIARANCKSEVDNVKTVLSEFFILDNAGEGCYRNKRADDELLRRLEISTKRAQAGRIGGSTKSQANAKQLRPQSQSQSQERPKIFISPTLEEVSEFCKEHPKVDPVKFWNYYEANGWRVGRTPMKKWQSAIVTWERQEHSNGNARESAAEARRRKNAEVFAQFRDEGTGNNG